MEQREKRVVYVGGLDEEVTVEILHAAFIPFGDIVEVNIPKDFKENKHRGFGFVEYETEDDAMAAIDNMDGSELYGRVLRVNQARAITHKLGNVKPVWSQDEWFKKALQDDEDLGAQMEFDSMMKPAEAEKAMQPAGPPK